MNRNLTSFFYLKTLKKIEDTNYKLPYAIFHLQRFLFLNENIKWARLFYQENDGMSFGDYGGGLTIRLLLHHGLIRKKKDTDDGYKHANAKDDVYIVKENGHKHLEQLKNKYPDLDAAVEKFFASYNGETFYTNSCMAQTERKFVACHLCTNPICTQDENIIANSYTSVKKSLFKSPYRSYSNAVAN